MNRIASLKPTLFSVFSIAGIIIGIPLGIYCLSLPHGVSLAGEVILWGVALLFLLLFLDRTLVRSLSPKKLSIIELIVVILGIFVCYLV